VTAGDLGPGVTAGLLPGARPRTRRDRDRDYGGTAATRAFWKRAGFTQVDTIDPFPGWQPPPPRAIYVAALRPTR
jgi:hypothetical protein